MWREISWRLREHLLAHSKTFVWRTVDNTLGKTTRKCPNQVWDWAQYRQILPPPTGDCPWGQVQQGQRKEKDHSCKTWSQKWKNRPLGCKDLTKKYHEIQILKVDLTISTNQAIIKLTPKTIEFLHLLNGETKRSENLGFTQGHKRKKSSKQNK